MVVDLPPDHPGRVAVDAIYQYVSNVPGFEGVQNWTIRYNDEPYTFYNQPRMEVVATAQKDERAITFHAGDTDVRRFLNTLGMRLINKAPKNIYMDDPAVMAIRTVIHEYVHTLPAASAWADMTQNQRYIEEGAADAVALDLTYNVARKIWGAKHYGFGVHPDDSSYDSCTRWVRKLSVSVTGHRLNSPQARRYRFQFATSTLEQRSAMLMQAGYDPFKIHLCNL